MIKIYVEKMKYLEPPITDASRLTENSTVWTKEAKHAPIWQAPMPDLTKIFEIVVSCNGRVNVSRANLPDI